VPDLRVHAASTPAAVREVMEALGERAFGAPAPATG